ncbi:MAG TPA: PhnD/SsuA/transferrin family substrate-binding protein [Clostridia bacterium]|nr:PhnD/SsuA/transferrin family substrate-binding protein [Clostridia bacterium]
MRTGFVSVAVILVLAVLIVLMPIAAWADISEVRVGVLANKGKSAAIETWQPLVDYLGDKIQEHRFILVPLDFDELYPEVEAGRVDFIITNTGQYIELEANYGISRIATFRNAGPGGFYTKFGGVLFVCAHRDDIRTIRDFPGCKILVADEKSFGGWLMQLREIKAQGINPDRFAEFRSAGNHEEVVFSILEGKSDIGAVRTDTLERMAEEGKIDLNLIRIINEQYDSEFPFRHSTGLYPEWPFAKTLHTNSLIAQNVAVALLTLPEDSYAARAAQSGGWTIPEDYNSAHELFRELQLGPYEFLGEFNIMDVIKKYWQVILLSVLLLIVTTVAAAWISVANRRLGTALSELNTSHIELEKANNLLTESMQYARIIQESLLPNQRVLDGVVADFAVLWEPLNIIGGDYYWMEQVDGKALIFVADCTGHGIPGAMVTMVLSASLDFILHEEGLTDPEQILMEIDQAVRSRLRQDEPGSTSDDGLEAAVCIYDPCTGVLSFAGAGLPLLWVKGENGHLIRGDKACLGYRTLRPRVPFEVHELVIEPDMTLYMFTDGITDQMGGTPRRLFGRRRLIDLIAGLSQQSLAEQIPAIEDCLRSYRQNENVRDDMTLIGFRFK